MQYIINGRKYTFINIGTEAGVRRGFCVRNKKWAWLYSNDYIQFDGESPSNLSKIWWESWADICWVSPDFTDVFGSFYPKIHYTFVYFGEGDKQTF